jgi:tetratricopeptide (TPR) repeat protein
MSDLLVGALSVLLATNQPAALSNYVAGKTGVPALVEAATAPKPDLDPRAVELRRVMELDDEADLEIGKWLNEKKPTDVVSTSVESPLALRARMLERLTPVRREYERFIERYPDYAPARNAFASFLAEIEEEEEAVKQLEKAVELDPKDPAIWNNLGNHYGHVGPVQKAFPAYEKAMQLNPFEPIYRYNLATVVFLFRKDAREHYGIDEDAVFAKALDLYREVRRLRPHNFQYAFDFAQTFYGVRLSKEGTAADLKRAEAKLAEAALGAWAEARELADNEEDREGIFLHQARWHLRAGDLAAVRTNLVLVTNAVHLELRQRLERNLAQKVSPAPEAVPGTTR